MNTRQKTVVIVWMVAITLILLFPPWTILARPRWGDDNQVRITFTRFLFLLSIYSERYSPSNAYRLSAKLDHNLLIIGLIGISAISFGMFKLLGNGGGTRIDPSKD